MSDDIKALREALDADHAAYPHIATFNAPKSTIRALLSELDAARKDAERLDWLDAEVSGDPGGRRILCLPGALRSAIDAAMKEQQP